MEAVLYPMLSGCTRKRKTEINSKDVPSTCESFMQPLAQVVARKLLSNLSAVALCKFLQKLLRKIFLKQC